MFLFFSQIEGKTRHQQKYSHHLFYCDTCFVVILALLQWSGLEVAMCPRYASMYICPVKETLKLGTLPHLEIIHSFELYYFITVGLHL